VSAEDERIVVK